MTTELSCPMCNGNTQRAYRTEGAEMTICESKVGPRPTSIHFTHRTCGFVCTTEHWDALPRKMTVEDANALLSAVVDAAEDGPGSDDFDEAWSDVMRELTGKESDDV